MWEDNLMTIIKALHQSQQVTELRDVPPVHFSYMLAHAAAIP